jgi:insertion element IS1 protein InsB
MNFGMKVDDKGNKQWIWLAIDAKTREVIGDRSLNSAQALWDSLLGNTA